MFDADMRAYFDACGKIGKRPTANAEKVRRVVHLIDRLAGKPWPELSVLDLATGHATYALECALHGAKRVLGIDARTERMKYGVEFAERLGLDNLAFEQADVRAVNQKSHGEWDAVLFLGILYHLDAPDCFKVLESLAQMGPLLIVDALIVAKAQDTVLWRERPYHGTMRREHKDGDSLEIRRGRVKQSINNIFSFYWTRTSLCAFLAKLGYTIVVEVHVPLEPQKPANRVTLAALRGEPLPIHIYPWIRLGGAEVDG